MLRVPVFIWRASLSTLVYQWISTTYDTRMGNMQQIVDHI